MCEQEFRTGSSRVLIGTDLISRGIDVHQVSLVFNFDLPLERESYIHRYIIMDAYIQVSIALIFRIVYAAGLVEVEDLAVKEWQST